MTENQKSLNETIGADARAGDVFASNDRVRLDPYNDSHFEDHVRLQSAVNPGTTSVLTSTATAREFYRQSLVERTEGVLLVVFDQASNEFVGEVAVHDFDADQWEIGCELLPEFQGVGYGSSATSLLVNTLKGIEKCPGVIGKIDADNAASIHMVRKLGGVPAGTGLTSIGRFLGEEGRAKFAREHQDLLNDEVRAMAKEFHVEPEHLLTHVLVFKL